MKLSVVGLFALGLTAAVAAAVLVASLQKQRRPQTSATPSEPPPAAKAQVLVAAKDLPAMTVLGAQDVAVRELDAHLTPEQALGHPVQVIGRVCAVALKAEQAILSSHLASDGSTVELISALQQGKRAVNIQLSDPMGVEELLYPGCLVDVLASLKAKRPGDQTSEEETLSVTLMQGITVLAIGARTIVSPGESVQKDEFVVKEGRRPPVTLLVDPAQAEMLKLAMHNGSVSLVLRNPLDQEIASGQGKRLVDLSALLKQRETEAHQRAMETAAAQARAEARKSKLEGFEMQRATFDNERDRERIEIDREKLDHEKWKVAQERAAETERVWQTVVIRGGVPQTMVFKRPTEKAGP